MTHSTLMLNRHILWNCWKAKSLGLKNHIAHTQTCSTLREKHRSTFYTPFHIMRVEYYIVRGTTQSHNTNLVSSSWHDHPLQQKVIIKKGKGHHNKQKSPCCHSCYYILYRIVREQSNSVYSHRKEHHFLPPSPKKGNSCYPSHIFFRLLFLNNFFVAATDKKYQEVFLHLVGVHYL